MIDWLRRMVVYRVFGEGLGATVADRGIDWLAEEGSKAVRREPEELAKVRLSPGDSYTVLVRPPANRAERKLAAASRGLAEAERKATQPTRKQRRAARRLQSAQRRLDRSRAGSRRRRRAAAVEAEAGRRFDAVMAPSKRLRRIRSERRRVDGELDVSRASSLAAVRRRSGLSSTVVYD